MKIINVHYQIDLLNNHLSKIGEYFHLCHIYLFQLYGEIEEKEKDTFCKRCFIENEDELEDSIYFKQSNNYIS